jgi:hypothetical protein
MATTEEAFSDQLEEWLGGEEPKTLGALSDAFEEKTFAVTIMLLMFVPALPLPTGGITHVFEAVVVLLGAEMVIGLRTIWLPERVKRRELGSLSTGKALPFVLKRVRWFERFSRPRWARLLDQGWARRLLGLVFIALAISAAFAPPFSALDTLPALGAVLVALGIILEDVVVVGAGIALGSGGVVLMITIGAALARVLRNLF